MSAKVKVVTDHNSGNKCQTCASPALRLVTTVDRGITKRLWLCALHATPVIHAHDLYDEAINPGGKKS